jgi:hypothetical protein
MKKQTIIGIDIDNVLRDWVKAFNLTFAKEYPEYAHEVKEAHCWNWFLDYSWDKICVGSNLPPKQFAVEWALKNQRILKELLLEAPLCPMAEEGIAEAQIFQETNHQVKFVIITKQDDLAAKVYTLQWLAKYSFAFSQIIFVRDWAEKWEYCDVMIDDSPDVLFCKPKDKVSVKINQIYNKDSESDYQFDNILEAIEMIKLNYQKL